MRMLLVRHAQTIENQEHRFQGHIHGRLSDLGKKQTQLLAEALKNEEIDLFYGSPLGRARETLEAVRIHHSHLQAVFTDALKERGKGVYEGLGIEETEEKEPGILAQMKDPRFVPDGGESLEQVNARLHPFLEEIRGKHAGKTVLLVGHHVLNNQIFRYYLDTQSEFSQHNACINELWLSESQVRVVRLNDYSHLKGLETPAYI
ncbi:histidine phosphatase family protein [Candidatus Micrarchaeota archaeon]|nr:histidine phosphatase family protein [Candidatus Micrarchaeota archaeon]